MRGFTFEATTSSFPPIFIFYFLMKLDLSIGGILLSPPRLPFNSLFCSQLT